MPISQKPFYRPIKQKPYCCVPACVSMILDRRKIEHGSQEEIGYELGLIVPEEKTHLFTKIRTGKKPIAGYGTQVNKKEHSITNYFFKNKIKLKEAYYSSEKVKGIRNFIIENLKNGNDLIVCFNNKKLHGGEDLGHVSLIQNINNNIVTLIDPENGVPNKRKVKLQKLVEAMKYHGKKKRGGFWVISE
jgi:hypothetical protein